MFIMTDQQRFDAMSIAGNKILETPNMDRIAREGVIFKHTYSANPVCVPARAVLLGEPIGGEVIKVICTCIC